jgi:flagellar basal body rod protein FlgG
MVDHAGYVVTAGSNPRRLLDQARNPIRLINTETPLVAQDGVITQGAEFVAQVGVFKVDNPSRLVKSEGSTLLPGQAKLTRADTTIRAQFVEHANIDPTVELTALMQTQRELEANANMIRYQDQMLAKAVNEVGKIS